MEEGNITGYVLAGGKSSRMGTDKAMLEFRGQPLLLHLLELIKPHCNNVFISGSNVDYESFGVGLVPDIYQDKGPLGGLYSVLLHSKSEANLIVSVDNPMITSKFIGLLTSEYKDSDCIVPVHKSGVEPLIAVYNKRIVPVIETMLQGENYKLLNLLSRIDTRYIDCNFLLESNPKLFTNLNRMEDYQSV